ncbi:MAG: MOSC domain-containing protein, partial [Acidobacteriota bacterium]|nr:MOSC domain-containing protein [Acidobacteriota bacterium]
MQHLSLAQIRAGLPVLLAAPADSGRVEMIVRRPHVNARELLESASLDVAEGLVGDTWKDRASSRTPDATPHPDMQLTLMGVRVISLLAGRRERWPLAGDQLFVDLD